MENKVDKDNLDERRRNLHYVLTKEKQILDLAYGTLYDKISRLQVEEQILLVFLQKAREQEGLPYESFHRDPISGNALNNSNLNPNEIQMDSQNLPEHIIKRADMLSSYKRPIYSSDSDNEDEDEDMEEYQQRSTGGGSKSDNDINEDDETARMALRELLDQYEQDME